MGCSSSVPKKTLESARQKQKSLNKTQKSKCFHRIQVYVLKIIRLVHNLSGVFDFINFKTTVLSSIECFAYERLSPLLSLRQFLAAESPFKMIKYDFCFMLKPLLILEIFKCLPWLFGRGGKRLDHKAEVNFKLMTLQTGKQIITIHILPNISRSKWNQEIKICSIIRI